MRKVHWRKNVLLLVAMAYTALVLIFFALAWGPMTANDAYEQVHSAFMALVGGTLAISKDLVDSIVPTDNDSFSNPKQLPNNEEKKEG